jgi:ribosomal protein S18 acetylase RimI-like enzyme
VNRLLTAVRMSGAEYDAGCARLAEAAYAGVAPTTVARARQSFETMRSTTGLHRLGIVGDGMFRGFVAATAIGQSRDGSGHACQVWWLGVGPGDRRRGIGRQLMEVLESHARREAVDHLWLWTWQRAGEAMAFYEEIGWKRTQRVVVELMGDARGPLEVRWVYRLDLGGSQ